MRVARGGVDFVVTQELADHAQALTEGKGSRGESVSEVMNVHGFEAGFLGNDLPLGQTAEAGAVYAIRQDLGGRATGEAAQHSENLRRRL